MSTEHDAGVNGHRPGTPIAMDLTALAAENAAFSERRQNDPYAFSGEGIEHAFLESGESLGATLLRSHFEKDTYHLSAMQIEQGLRVLRIPAMSDPASLPPNVKEWAVLPPSLVSALVGGLVSAGKDGGARAEALMAWSGGSLMLKRQIGKRLVNPGNGQQQGNGLS